MLQLLVGVALASEPPASGRFVSNQDRAAIDAELAAAVDRSAQSVSYVYRLVARPMLADQATACPAYTTKLDGDVFTVQCDGKDPFTWTIGTSGPLQRADETLQVTSKRDGTAIVLDFAGERGGKKYTYSFSPSGLAVAYEIYSPYLGDPMRWTLTFDRKE